jgi:EAL domain-containing protein (putative c-di-GMP-specific phosphodiesterase class I)
MGLECMLKADASTVPQVLQTARQLLLRQRVPALQLELTKTNKQSDQTCAAIKMLNHLHEIGFRFKQVREGL